MNTNFCYSRFIRFWRKKCFSWILANAVFYWHCHMWHMSCEMSRQVTCEIKCIIETYYKSVFLNHSVLNLYAKSPHHHLPVGQKPLLKHKYVWTQTQHHVASTSIRGWNMHPNIEDFIRKPDKTCLIWKIVSLIP